MTAQDFIDLLDCLDKGIHPLTARPFDVGTSFLKRPRVEQHIGELRAALTAPAEEATEIPLVTDATLAKAVEELRALDYVPTVEQLCKVLRGSRTIADPGLRGLETYALLRGATGKRELKVAVTRFADRHAELFPGRTPKSTKTKSVGKATEPWREVDFFTTAGFDALTEEKATELANGVGALGLARTAESLPEYMARTRAKYPRSYEPWAREEQALLVEAMCYTNDAKRLGEIFGRSASSVTSQGKRLIWNSRQRHGKVA